MGKILRFHLFRLSLRRSQQKHISEFLNGLKDREEWLRALFSQTVEFRHRGVDYAYIPIESTDGTGLIYGRIGRRIIEVENRSPAHGFTEYLHEAWKAAVLILDPGDHKDGQKLSIQSHPDVGKPSSIAPRLIQALEERIDGLSYLTSVHEISNEEAFWDFVKRNEGRVTRLTVLLEVPNMFGGDQEYDDEMRKFRDIEHAQKVKVEISNPEGLDLDTERVHYTVEKAMSKGTGLVTARAMGKNNKFSSENQQEVALVEVPDDNKELSLEELKGEFADRILGRDEV